MDVLERLAVTLRVAGAVGAPQTVGLQHKIVSLWFRDEVPPDPINFRVRFIAPNQDLFGEFAGRIDFGVHERIRSVVAFDGLPVTTSGIYKFTVDAEFDGQNWTRVAEVPLEIAVEVDAGTTVDGALNN